MSLPDDYQFESEQAWINFYALEGVEVRVPTPDESARLRRTRGWESKYVVVKEGRIIDSWGLSGVWRTHTAIDARRMAKTMRNMPVNPDLDILIDRTSFTSDQGE